MATRTDWQPAPSGKSVFKVESRNLGWWVVLALLTSVVIHIGLYLLLGVIQRNRSAAPVEQIVWINARDQVTIDRDKLEELLADPIIPEDVAEPEKLSDLDLIDDSLDEFDLMEQMKTETIRMAPIETPQLFVGDRPTAPTPGMAPGAEIEALELASSEMLAQDLDAMRNKLIDDSALVSQDQPVIELNANEDSSDVDTDEFFRNAATQAFGNGADEALEGYSSLDDLISRTGGLPTGEEKIAMPTDILFGYNESALKEEARLSMMKLAFLIQTNPDARFVIEGHTDSFGGDDYNEELGLKRAEAVRAWLVQRLRISDENIQVVGVGKARPIVSIDGDKDAQALNRRVEIIVKTP
ncbi:MAG: OmpA family protein [Verrucomicrobiota bacterium]